MRAVLISLIALSALGGGAAAQISSAPNTVPGTETNPFPVIQMRPPDAAADHYRHLPFRDLATAIRIEIASAALYDFNTAQVRNNAADYLQLRRALGRVRRIDLAEVADARLHRELRRLGARRIEELHVLVGHRRGSFRRRAAGFR